MVSYKKNGDEKSSQLIKSGLDKKQFLGGGDGGGWKGTLIQITVSISWTILMFTKL